MHVYVTDGDWASDFDGWTAVGKLLAVTRAAGPDAGYEQRPLEIGLAAFCREHNHRDRPYYAFETRGNVRCATSRGTRRRKSIARL